MKLKRIIKYSIKLCFILVVIFNFLSCTTRLGMYHLPKGDYISSLDSPNKCYTLKSYRYSGGATVDWSLRVELVNNKTNKKTNIYYKYHESEANMKWINNEYVIINGVKLNIHKDYYHKG